jgi:hypothetical protein
MLSYSHLDLLPSSFSHLFFSLNIIVPTKQKGQPAPKMSEIDHDTCTLDTCPIDLAYINYQPNLGANILFLAIFAFFLAGQLVVGSWFRTWTYMGAMSAGLILEVLGYVGRIMMHNNPFDFNAFLLYVPKGKGLTRFQPPPPQLFPKEPRKLTKISYSDTSSA